MTDTVISDGYAFPQDEGIGSIPDDNERQSSAGWFGALAAGVSTPEVDGLEFNDVDTTNDQVDVNAGMAYVDVTSVSAQSALGDVAAGYDVTLPEPITVVLVVETEIVDLGLATGSVNDLWLAYDTSNGDVYVRHGNGLSAPSDPSVKLGTVDTSDGSTSRATSGITFDQDLSVNGSLGAPDLYTEGRAADVIVAEDSGTWRAMGEASELASGSDAGSVINSALSPGRTVVVVDDFSTSTTVQMPQDRFAGYRGTDLEVQGQWTYTGTGAACVLGQDTVFSTIRFEHIRTSSNSASVAFRNEGAEWNQIIGRLVGGEQTGEPFSHAGIEYAPPDTTNNSIGGHNLWLIQRISSLGDSYTTSYGIDLPSNPDTNIQGSNFYISVIKQCAQGIRDGTATSDRTHKYNHFRIDIDQVDTGNPIFVSYGEDNTWHLTGQVSGNGDPPEFKSSVKDTLMIGGNIPEPTIASGADGVSVIQGNNWYFTSGLNFHFNGTRMFAMGAPAADLALKLTNGRMDFAAGFASETADSMTADPESSSEDGYIEIDVNGTTYQIPVYSP